MRLTPSQRVHAVCAFVVPIVLVLMFAPGPEARGHAGQKPSVERCADAHLPSHCEAPTAIAHRGAVVAHEQLPTQIFVARDEAPGSVARDLVAVLSGAGWLPVLIEEAAASTRPDRYEAPLR